MITAALPSLPPASVRGPLAVGSAGEATVIPLRRGLRAAGRPPRPTRVLVVADRPLTRASLRALLEGQRQVRVVGDAGFGDDPAAWARRLRPDVAVVVPEAAGSVASARRFAAAAAGAGAGVLVVADPDAGAALGPAPGGGVLGLLSTDAGPHDLARAVRMIASCRARRPVALAPALPTPT